MSPFPVEAVLSGMLSLKRIFSAGLISATCADAHVADRVLVDCEAMCGRGNQLRTQSQYAGGNESSKLHCEKSCSDDLSCEVRKKSLVGSKYVYRVSPKPSHQQMGK